LEDDAESHRWSTGLLKAPLPVSSADNDGVISAWHGVQEITAEHQALLAKVGFYFENGVGVAGGLTQIKSGIGVIGETGGLAGPYGIFLIAHGINNVYEGGLNIYNSYDGPRAQGPTRRAYQEVFKDPYTGDMAYGTIDLLLSGAGLLRSVRKADTVQLFRNDPINYERAYEEAGKLALLLEALVDAVTLKSMITEEKPDEISR
jgi:hypothetical protein